MTPDQCKAAIQDEYLYLLKRANGGKLNHSAIYRIVEGSARAAASHNGIPEFWKEYMPHDLQIIQGGER
jgi:hypothetical protein